MEKISIINRIGCVAILACTLLLSCRKKDFPQTDTLSQSDFQFNATIDGQAVSVKAGFNKYYMYSSHSFNTNNLYNFIADLKPEACNTCNNSLQLIINDLKYSSPQAGVNIDSSLAPGSYPILNTPQYAVQFRSLFNQTAASYLWNFGDNTTSSLANPLHTYSATGNYSVSLRINSVNGCQQYISNVEQIKLRSVNPAIAAVSHSANKFRFNVSNIDSSLYTYFWDFGDGDTSQLFGPTHTYKIPGTYPVILKIKNQQQEIVYSKHNVATQTNPMPCVSNYSIESVSMLSNALTLGRVIINWTDENGEVFTSNNTSQPTTSNFKILSVEDYDLNERGEKTRKIKVKFNCRVYNGARVKVIENADAVLGVSYR